MTRGPEAIMTSGFWVKGGEGVCRALFLVNHLTIHDSKCRPKSSDKGNSLCKYCGNDRQQILRVLREMSLNFPRSFMFAKIAKPACPAVDRSRRAGASSPSLRNLGSWDPQKSEFQGQEHRAAAPGPSSRASQNSTCMHSWTLRE